MNAEWRLFILALRCFTRLPVMGAPVALLGTDPYPVAGRAARYLPLVGVIIGGLGGSLYWIGAQLWPTSIAVTVSLLATTLLSAESPQQRGDGLRFVFTLLLKYNALMALSAASLPFALPPNFALGLIMIAGAAASRAMAFSILPPKAARSRSNADFVFAFAVGFAPAMPMGLPGLIGLACAIAARLLLGAYFHRRSAPITALDTSLVQQATEVCFYLGALAAWAYV